MQSIATANNLSETAFVTPANNGYDLRWFTPTVEVDLCGHATLATAFVLHQFDDAPDKLEFHTKSGTLTVICGADLYRMDFPSRPPRPFENKPEFAAAIGAEVTEAYISRDVMLGVANETTVRNLKPDFAALEALTDGFGVIVTAAGDGEADFVSRFFVPKGGVPEDPVTGSAHATLTPFWAARLGKSQMTAHQLSARGGAVYCTDRGDRVEVAGHARLSRRG